MILSTLIQLPCRAPGDNRIVPVWGCGRVMLSGKDGTGAATTALQCPSFTPSTRTQGSCSPCCSHSAYSGPSRYRENLSGGACRAGSDEWSKVEKVEAEGARAGTAQSVLCPWLNTVRCAVVPPVLCWEVGAPGAFVGPQGDLCWSKAGRKQGGCSPSLLH